MKIINIDVDSELIVKNVYDTESKVEKNDSNSLKIPTGNYKTIMLNFNFISPKFEEADLKLFASFNNDFLDKPVMAEVTSIVEAGTTYNHACYIPGELLRNTGKVKLGLFGYILNEETQELEKRYSLQPISSEVVLGSFQEDMVNAATPTPTVFELYFQQVKDMADQVADDYKLVRTAIENVKNENITDFNKKAEAKKTSLVSDFDTHASNKLKEVKENIDSHVAGKIDEYDAHADDLIGSVADTRNELERVKNDILETGEASDTSIHLKDSAMAEMQELGVDGPHKQVTTQGYNLANVLNFKNTEILTVNTDQSLTLANNPQSSGYVETNVTLGNLAPDLKAGDTIYLHLETTFTSQANIYINGGTRLYDGSSVTVTEEMLGKKVILYGGATKVDTIRLQFTKDELKTIWEPYSGGQESPNPNWEQPIEVIEEDFDVTTNGNQLVDFSVQSSDARTTFTFENDILTIKADGTSGYQTYYKNITKLLKNNPGKSISFNFEKFDFAINHGESFVQINVIYNDRTATSYNILLDRSLSKRKYNIPSDTSNIQQALFSIYANSTTATANTITITKPMLTFDENAEYEPYQETKVTFEIPEGEFFGSVSDTIKDEAKIVFNEEDGQYHKVIKKNIGKRVFDGSENWSTWGVNNSTDGITGFYSMDFNDYNQSLIKHIKSTHFEVNVNAWGGAEIGINASASSNPYIIMAIPNDALNDISSDTKAVESFKTWLSNNLVEAYYPLKEPYTLDLGVVDMPLTFDEVTNISSSHNLQPKINVKYYRNFISTIKNLQVNEKALKQELVDINSRLKALENSLINVTSESEVVE